MQRRHRQPDSRRSTAQGWLVASIAVLALAGGGCGTELGNPLAWVFGGGSGEPASNSIDGVPPAVLTQLMLGAKNADCLDTKPYDDLLIAGGAFVVPLAAGWSEVPDPQSAATSSLVSNDPLTQMQLESSDAGAGIENLLSYIVAVRPDEAWVAAVNAAGTTLVVNEEVQPGTSGTSIYEVYATSGDTLLKLLLELEPDTAASDEALCSLNHLAPS